MTEFETREGVRSNATAILRRPRNQRGPPLIKARIVTYYANEKNREFEFITNDFDPEAFEIASIYKRRWQIEMLSRKIKQRSPLKYFLGDSQCDRNTDLVRADLRSARKTR